MLSTPQPKLLNLPSRIERQRDTNSCGIIATASLEQTALFQIVLGTMPANRIQPRTWFVELQLSTSDADVQTGNVGIKEILELSNKSRPIRGLQHVSLAYLVGGHTLPDLAGTQLESIIVDVIGFAHCNESILDTTMHSWIQDWHVKKPALDSSLRHTRRWQQLDANGYHQEFLR